MIAPGLPSLGHNNMLGFGTKKTEDSTRLTKDPSETCKWTNSFDLAGAGRSSIQVAERVTDFVCKKKYIRVYVSFFLRGWMRQVKSRTSWSYFLVVE